MSVQTVQQAARDGAEGTARVVFSGINKDYAGVQAVVDLNLAIGEGEFFTLLGPSGSGKTTTLRMLAGLEGISSGEIRIAGREMSREVPEKRNIGMVFQNYALFPHLSVADNIAFPLKMRHTAKAEIARRVEDVLQLTDLISYRDRRPAQLSGGQQQRVALARAFVFDPSILLMDEPLGALDRNLRDHMRIELKALQQRIGATVLYVTHDQDEALAMSDRIGIMHRGVLQQVASPVEMYEHPANSFVARFLGESVCLPARRIDRGACSMLQVEGISDPVRVDPTGDVCDDDTGVFMIRPERFVLEATQPSTPAVNRVCGVVETTVYLGSSLQVYMRDAAGAVLHVVVPPDQAVRAVAGTRLWATWQPQDCRFRPGAE